MHTHRYMQIYIHRHIYTYKDIHIYAHRHTQTYTHRHTNTHTQWGRMQCWEDWLTLYKNWDSAVTGLKQGCLAMFQEHGFVFFDFLGLLLVGLKSIKTCSHSALWRWKLKYILSPKGSPQGQQQFTFRNPRSVRRKRKGWDRQESHCPGAAYGRLSLLTYETPLEELLLGVGVVS